MRIVEKTFDTNALIENISYKIDVRAGVPYATITFDNSGYGDITAVKFTASGYNTFGDVITVNGSPTFTIIVQDIKVPANKKGFSTTVSLPHNDIRTLGIVQNQVCLSDGRVLTYQGEKLLELILEEYTADTSDEREELSALREKFGKDYKYVPTETEGGWLCACGRLNSKENLSCINCRNSKAELFEYTDKAKIDALIEDKKLREEKRKVINDAQNLKKKTRVDFLIVIALVLLIFAQAVYSTLDIGFSFNYGDFGIKLFQGLLDSMPWYHFLLLFMNWLITVLPCVALAFCAWFYPSKPKAGKVFLSATFILWGADLIRRVLNVALIYPFVGMMQAQYSITYGEFPEMVLRSLEYLIIDNLIQLIAAAVWVVVIVVLHIPSVVLSLTGTKNKAPFLIVATFTALLHFTSLMRAIRSLFEEFPYSGVMDGYSYMVGMSKFFIYLQWWLYKGVNFLSVLLPVVIFSILLITVCVRFAPKPKEKLAPKV